MILMRDINYTEAYLESSFARNDSFADHTVRKCQVFLFLLNRQRGGKEFVFAELLAGGPPPLLSDVRNLQAIHMTDQDSSHEVGAGRQILKWPFLMPR